MSLDNLNFQDQQEDLRSNDYLSEYQYKKNQISQKESQNSKLKKNNILIEQIPSSEFQTKSQKEAKIQNQKNEINSFQFTQKKNNNSLDNEEISEIQFQLNQTQEEQQHSQVRKNSQLKIQPVFNINIQITRIYHRTSKSQNPIQNLQNIKKKGQNELKSIQQIQSNIFQSQCREIINKSQIINTSQTNQSQISDFQKVNLDFNSNLSQLKSFEMKLRIQDDPMLKEKQDMLLDIYEILKKLTIKSNCKKHSILEDALQVCLMFLPDIRGSYNQLISLQFFEKIKETYELERTHQAFIRRFYHLSLFSNSWTIQNIKKMCEIIMDNQKIPLDAYHINYNITNKTIEFPTPVEKKKQPEKPKAIQKIIKNRQNKRIVLSLTTKTLFQYVDLSAKEIDEDIQEFDDELQFIEMILKLIPLAL